MAQFLPTHLFGDPLQGIFDFNGPCVSLDDDLADFERFPPLPTPYRWHKSGHTRQLGNAIKEMRTLLEQGKLIELSDDPQNGLHIFLTQKGDLHRTESKYREMLKRILNNKKKNAELDSLLILVPE